MLTDITRPCDVFFTYDFGNNSFTYKKSNGEDAVATPEQINELKEMVYANANKGGVVETKDFDIYINSTTSVFHNIELWWYSDEKYVYKKPGGEDIDFLKIYRNILFESYKDIDDVNSELLNRVKSVLTGCYDYHVLNGNRPFVVKLINSRIQ